MPGIIGFTNCNFERAKQRQILKNMQDMITYQDYYKQDELFCDDSICATRSSINVIQKEPQPYYQDGVYIWLDGEFNNQDDLLLILHEKYRTDPVILYSLYRDHNDFSFLEKIDGIFAAVIYDSNQQKIYLISDRYGLRYLYWTVFNGSLFWGSELKVMLALPGYSPEIDPQAISEFFSAGYLLENHTWFKNIQLLSSGTILSWDIKEKKFCQNRYWWWDKIQVHTGKFNENEIIEELGRLFIDAISKRSQGEAKVGLTLSGGLDSRAILAAIPELDYPIHAMTFGKNNCDDIKLAALACKVKGAVHHFVNLDVNNFIAPRLEGVWWTDGQVNFIHLHGIETIGLLKQFIQVNLNGFAGDLVFGGSYLKSRDFFDKPVNHMYITKLMKCNESIIGDISEYLKLPKIDYYFLQNRVRRFTYGGTKHALTKLENRKPFFDNNLVEFIYSLPDSLRWESYIYKKVLLKFFPEYFKTIPWQKTGVPISWSPFTVGITRFSQRIRNKSRKELSKLGIKFFDATNYTNYPEWLRQEPVRPFINKVLLNKEALYQNYFSHDQVSLILERHLQGDDYTEKIGLYLTFELWLQQVFNGLYR